MIVKLIPKFLFWGLAKPRVSLQSRSVKQNESIGKGHAW